MTRAGLAEAGTPAAPPPCAPSPRGHGGRPAAHLEVLVLLLRQRPLGHHEGAQAFAGHVAALQERGRSHAARPPPPAVTATSSASSSRQTHIPAGGRERPARPGAPAPPDRRARLSPHYGSGTGCACARHRHGHTSRAGGRHGHRGSRDSERPTAALRNQRYQGTSARPGDTLPRASIAPGPVRSRAEAPVPGSRQSSFTALGNVRRHVLRINHPESLGFLSNPPGRPDLPPAVTHQAGCGEVPARAPAPHSPRPADPGARRATPRCPFVPPCSPSLAPSRF